MVHPVAQSELLEKPGGARLRGATGEPADAERERDVFQRGEFGKEPVVLEHEPDVAVAESGCFLVGEPPHLLTGEADRAAFGAVEGAEDMQQRRLAGAAAAGHRHHLADRHVQIQLPENFDPAGAGIEPADESARLQERVHRCRSATGSGAPR